ncbi:uncharacterized protein LOC116406071 [Cucumis sativus]|uniref:uncharacterized protein LOC116403410 n=1 Tax=Cucumis sativus TaxID=3659 RepID=UPI0012F4975E|nr:uncharacterized protein LOC116403410 [Cucumis sativus]XP_031745639.1 uncharacterized protein LOC116406071 [Cucumis sativus]
MKVDLQKAYDSVNWDFLFGLLIAIDDLMIFCTADNHSMSFIKETIKRFCELSGLFANLPKAQFFLWGLIVRKILGLAANMGFSIGHLPIVIWASLLLEDCGALIVIPLFSVLPFVFVLTLIILRAYLWRGKEEGRSGAKVAWDEVCLPFDEGGLDIRDGSSWNIASTLKILWLLLVKSGSLWVSWVESYILKGRSLWEIDAGVGRSWCFREILRKRDILKAHV